MLKWKLSLSFMVLLALTGCKIKVADSAKLRCEAESIVAAVDSGEVFEVKVTATGGEKPYFLLGATGDTFDSETMTLRSLVNEADDVVTMSGSIVVNDNIGFTTQCSFQVNVNPADEDVDPDVDPTLVTVATPATTASSESTITLTAIADGLGDSPAFTFAFAEAGVNVQQVGNQAIFSAADGEDHSFDVTVMGAGEGKDISEVVSLTFVKPTPETLNCTLTHLGGDDFEVGDNVEFVVMADNNEALEVFPQNPGASGTVVSSFGRYFTVQYATEGMKTVSVFAKSATRNVWCNGQAALTDMVDIDAVDPEPTPTPTPDPDPEFTCQANTDDTAYRMWCENSPASYGGYWNSVLTWATVSGNPVGSVEIVDVDINNNGDGSYAPYSDSQGNNPMAKEVFVETQGNYKLTLTVEDADGNQATCQTPTIQVWDYFQECLYYAF